MAAALILQVVGSPTLEGLQLADRVRKLKPDWLYPTLYTAIHRRYKDSRAWFDRARANPNLDLLPPGPFAFRRGLAILAASRKDLYEHRAPLIAPEP